ncbi:hypothetical protein DRH14_01930 [Candidatus Shapirobacteria bacterium]|nr:MAG: hypothetical protein DRH14_01930 [Candidatus Shapirobacteria bacterium]
MQILFWFLFSLVLIFFNYQLWKVLAKDYDSQKVIVFSWLLVFFSWLGGRLWYGLANWGVWNQNWVDWLSWWNKSGFSWWGAYVFLVVFSLFFSKKNDWKWWNVIEDVIVVVLGASSWWLLVEWLKFRSSKGLVSLGIVLFVYLLSKWIKTKYRSFYWYKSGRKGFVFLFANTLTFVLMFFLSILSLFPLKHQFLALGLGLIFGLGLFMLGSAKGKLLVWKRKNNEKED